MSFTARKDKEIGTTNTQRHLDLLGRKVSDKVTGFEGIVTTVSFDLFGCIQAGVTAKDDKFKWLDIRRVISGRRITIDIPDFNLGYIAEGRKGAVDKSNPMETLNER